ncbi:MAG: hypothetical protein NZN45_08075 [Rhodovarius sp.]|nr:hypothetical protein [Rhodovarius sp.]
MQRRTGPAAAAGAHNSAPLQAAAGENDIPRKLGYKPGMVCAVIEPPAGFRHGLPVSNASEPELILAFALDRASLGRVAARALDLYGVGGRLWFAYPKKTGPLRTDLDRDHGWEPLTQAGFLPVAQIALDATWSALRFRLREEVPTLMRKA